MVQRESVFEAKHEFEVEPRFEIKRSVEIRLAGSAPINAQMINFSRNGFCIQLVRELRPGEAVQLEIQGWPPLAARVAWNRNDKAGCRLDQPLSSDRYEAMILSADAVNRAGEWSI